MRRPIDRIAADDAASFAAHERADAPVVIEGGARVWPAVARWSPDYLGHLLGPIEIDYKLSATGAHPNFAAATMAEMFARGRSTFADFLAAITVGPEAERACRLFTGDEQFVLRRRDGVTTVHPPFAPLLADASVPPVIPPDQLYTVWAWFSGKGARTWLHYDNNGCHNLNAQIAGRKSCLLISPDQVDVIDLFPAGGPNPATNCSRIDAHAPGALADLDALTAELGPGDLLFIPAWWSHAFTHTGDFNANLNFWWKPARVIANPTAERQAALDARPRPP
jgi:lysine-specific demethylase 8